MNRRRPNAFQRLATPLLSLLAACLLHTPATSQAAERMRSKRNVSYVVASQHGVSHTLDIYAPATGEKLPVIFWIHGGAWKYGDKSMVDLKPRVFTEQGYVLVSINYRLHPHADFREQAEDVAAALKWTVDNISEYAGDPERIILLGHSAGAHLSALVGIDETYLQEVDLSLQDIDGVILLDGACYDVVQHIKDMPTVVKSFFQLIFTTNVKTQREASPLWQIEPGKKIPPFLILYVSQRKDSRIQSTRLAEALEQANVEVSLHGEDNEDHVSLSRNLGVPNRPSTRHVFDFLESLDLSGMGE